MEKIEVKLQVTKEAHELAMAVVEVIKGVKLALADGFQPGQDIPAIILGSLNHLMKGIEGADKLPKEALEDLGPFISAWMVGGAEIAQVFLKK